MNARRLTATVLCSAAALSALGGCKTKGEIVVGQIHRFERGIPARPTMTLIEGTWVEGPTVRPPPVAFTCIVAIGQNLSLTLEVTGRA